LGKFAEELGKFAEELGRSVHAEYAEMKEVDMAEVENYFGFGKALEAERREFGMKALRRRGS
jgi:hypothetical protein